MEIETLKQEISQLREKVDNISNSFNELLRRLDSTGIKAPVLFDDLEIDSTDLDFSENVNTTDEEDEELKI